MNQSCRRWWQNCAQTADDDILAIDAMEKKLTPLDPKVAKVRELISSFELCHHKAHRWATNIVEAIGTGETAKGLGTREPGRLHAAERVWEAACEALSAWCAGHPAASIKEAVGAVSAYALTTRIGARTSLKEWQVQRVIDKIRSLIHWPPTTDDPSAGYTWILFSQDEHGTTYRSECPERYGEHEDFWRSTVHTIIRDTYDGKEASLSLGMAIDMLWPCHWDFINNLEVVLGAIGGDLDPGRDFAACGRNISRLPNRDRYEQLCRSLQTFCDGLPRQGDVDAGVLKVLGALTPDKRWLAASLQKTIRLQLDPPDELRAIYSFPVPS